MFNVTKLGQFCSRSLFCLIILQLLGCASGPLKPLTEPAAGRGVANVYVMRNNNAIGSPNAFKVQLNGEDVLSIRTNQYATFRLAAGAHSIGVKSFGGLTPTTKVDTLQINVRDSEDLYFLISPHFSKNVEIEQITSQEAEAYIQKSVYIEMQYQ